MPRAVGVEERGDAKSRGRERGMLTVGEINKGDAKKYGGEERVMLRNLGEGGY